MSVSWQQVPVHMGKGVDTKTDAKLVQAGKLLRCQDAIQVAAQQWRKRNGYQKITPNILGGGTISSPKMMASFKDELVCAADGKLYSYSPTQAAWVDKGAYVPVAVTKEIVSRTGSVSHEGVSGAATGNIAVFAWSVGGVPTASVIDIDTGAALIADQALASANSGYALVQCILMGSGDLAVFYMNASNHPAMRKLTVSGTTVSFASEVQINTDTLPTTATGISICATTTGVALFYANTSTSYKLSLVNSSGSVTSSTTVSVSAAAGPGYLSSIARSPINNNIWCYFVSGSDVKFAIFSPTLVTVLASTTIPTNYGAGAFFGSAITALSVNATQQKLVYSISEGSNGDNISQSSTYYLSVTSTGSVGSSTLLVMGAALLSEPFTLGSDSYVAVNNFSADQATMFFVRISDGLILGKALGGSASDYRGYRVGPYPIDSKSFNVVKPIQLSSSRVLIPCGDAFQVYASYTVSGPRYSYILGTSYVSLDTADASLYQATEFNSNLVLNGGLLFGYDGASVTELGFSLFPEIFGITYNSGGSVANGTYTYYAVFRWTDAQGNIFESAPSTGTAATFTGTNAQAQITINTLGLTAKKSPTRGDVEVRLYRTTASGAANTARLVGTYTANDVSSAFVVITDTYSDTQTQYGEPLYTNGGTIENIAPPPALAMALHGNRLWLIDSENPNTLWYSKTALPGAGVSFSDLLVVQVDSVGGKCVALAGMDDKLVILEERQPLVIAGDGANDTGTGSTLTYPQAIPADTGCSQSKGVITFPGGVLFKSPKGIYLLDRSLGVKYFGAEVEAYNSQTISSTVILKDQNQIRFLCESGLTLVFDYAFGQWSTFSNHTGYGACIWDDSYVYARTSGEIYQETSGYYLDDTSAIEPILQTAWIAFGGVQGFQRVRRVEMLGAYANGADSNHGIQVSAAYDFEESFSDPVDFLFGNGGSSGLIQYRERLARQKCDAISLLIQEIATGDSAEFISLTDLSFEAGIKRGLNKLSAGRSVG